MAVSYQILQGYSISDYFAQHQSQQQQQQQQSQQERGGRGERSGLAPPMQPPPVPPGMGGPRPAVSCHYFFLTVTLKQTKQKYKEYLHVLPVFNYTNALVHSTGVNSPTHFWVYL